MHQRYVRAGAPGPLTFTSGSIVAMKITFERVLSVNDPLCQSGSWKKASGSSGSIGGFTFSINDYSPTLLFYGVGNYNSSTGTFTGELICDPQTVHINCGSGERRWCGSSASCAGGLANESYNNYITSRMVGTSALPIGTVTVKW